MKKITSMNKAVLKIKNKAGVLLIFSLLLMVSVSSVLGGTVTNNDVSTTTTDSILEINYAGGWIKMDNATIDDESVDGTVITQWNAAYDHIGNYNFTRIQIGSASNNITINETGTITLYGDARTLNDLWIDAGAIKAPGLKPATAIAHGILETPSWEFGNEGVAGNQESVSWSMRIPNRMDRTVAPIIAVGWSADGVSPGVCEWQLGYLWTSMDEDTSVGAQENITINGTASSTSNGLVVSSFIGIDIPSATDMCIHCKLTRLSAGTNDTIADTVELHGVCLQFTSNKIGGFIG